MRPLIRTLGFRLSEQRTVTHVQPPELAGELVFPRGRDGTAPAAGARSVPVTSSSLELLEDQRLRSKGGSLCLDRASLSAESCTAFRRKRAPGRAPRGSGPEPDTGAGSERNALQANGEVPPESGLPRRGLMLSPCTVAARRSIARSRVRAECEGVCQRPTRRSVPLSHEARVRFSSGGGGQRAPPSGSRPNLPSRDPSSTPNACRVSGRGGRCAAADPQHVRMVRAILIAAVPFISTAPSECELGSVRTGVRRDGIHVELFTPSHRSGALRRLRPSGGARRRRGGTHCAGRARWTHSVYAVTTHSRRTPANSPLGLAR